MGSDTGAEFESDVEAFSPLTDVSYPSHGCKLPLSDSSVFIIQESITGGMIHETENRKEAAELFAHAGDGRRADAGDEYDGVCRHMVR